MNIIREQLVEEVAATRSSREKLATFSKDASDRIGGIFVSVGAFQSKRAQVARPAARVEGTPLQAIHRILRVLEFVLLSLFSEQLASRRWNRTALQNEY